MEDAATCSLSVWKVLCWNSYEKFVSYRSYQGELYLKFLCTSPCAASTGSFLDRDSSLAAKDSLRLFAYLRLAAAVWLSDLL